MTGRRPPADRARQDAVGSRQSAGRRPSSRALSRPRSRPRRRCAGPIRSRSSSAISPVAARARRTRRSVRRPPGEPDLEVDRNRQDEAEVVVGVLTDQVHPARRPDDVDPSSAAPVPGPSNVVARIARSAPGSRSAAGRSARSAAARSVDPVIPVIVPGRVRRSRFGLDHGPANWPSVLGQHEIPCHPWLPDRRRATGSSSASSPFFWGSDYLFIKIGVETMPPMTLIAGRLFFGSPSSAGAAHRPVAPAARAVDVRRSSCSWPSSTS